MSRYPLQDGLTGQRAPNVRSDGPAGVPLRSLLPVPGRLGQARTEPEPRRQNGVRILKRTAKREGWGAGGAGGSSERTFGAPRPVINPGLTQRDMKREDPHAADPADPADPGAAREMTFSANSANTVRVVITEVEH